mmetsp:Transcript_50576/g.149218  ORF Transcript_50576/g.149218 Transcript_50576/m.149218 type:complete len:159 (+) Transcript_50576:1000-1476(+)
MTHHDAKIASYSPDYPVAFDDVTRAANPPRRVPLVLQHPVTRRRALYGMNSSTCAVLPAATPTSDRFDRAAIDAFELRGVEDASVSTVWRESLLPFATSAPFTLAVRWRAGDVALWDNRATIHAATGFDAANCTREMWRTTIVADHPETARDASGAAA